MIELAPQHKVGLSLTNPIMIASGFAGYGNPYKSLLDMSAFGAVVTQSITLRPRRGPAQPRLVETSGGFILNSGQQNPGVKKVLHGYGKQWAKLPTTVIAHLPADDPADLTRTARALFNAQGSVLAGFELGLPPQATPYEVEQWIRAIQQNSELPVLVKLPLNAPLDLAEAAAYAYADSLVLGSPPWGAALSPQQTMISGPLYSPALLSIATHSLQQLIHLDLPLIAAGGIHTEQDVNILLSAGATAIQLDSVLFVDPQAAETVAQAF